jgi:hypothetical protein
MSAFEKQEVLGQHPHDVIDFGGRLHNPLASIRPYNFAQR